MGYGADQAGTPPFFVVTHSPPRDVRLERELRMRFTFVGDLVIAIDQALEQGLVDELRLHLAPMVLGGGRPLFKAGTRQMYRQRDVRSSGNAVA